MALKAKSKDKRQVVKEVSKKLLKDKRQVVKEEKRGQAQGQECQRGQQVAPRRQG